MDAQNVLSAKNRSEFRSWLAENSQIASECWVTVKRGKPTDETEFWYMHLCLILPVQSADLRSMGTDYLRLSSGMLRAGTAISP